LIIFHELSLLPFIWRNLFWPSRCRPKIVRSLICRTRRWTILYHTHIYIRARYARHVEKMSAQAGLICMSRGIFHKRQTLGIIYD
jgi:CHASE1-domain containing sensor protein